jgi:hypothetical protein
MITFKEFAEISLEDVPDEGISGTLLTILGIARTLIQGEAATFEGECASALEWTKQHGKPTKEKILAWVDSLGEFAALQIPDSLLEQYLAAED